jgi:integrase
MSATSPHPRLSSCATQVSLGFIIELYLNPYLGRILLAKLTPEDVQPMINALVAKKLAPNTIRNIRAVLRRALNQALRWWLVVFNAASLAENPRIEQEQMSALDETQARALLRALKGDRLEVLYRVALSLGLRRERYWCKSRRTVCRLAAPP